MTYHHLYRRECESHCWSYVSASN